MNYLVVIQNLKHCYTLPSRSRRSSFMEIEHISHGHRALSPRPATRLAFASSRKFETFQTIRTRDTRTSDEPYPHHPLLHLIALLPAEIRLIILSHLYTPTGSYDYREYSHTFRLVTSSPILVHEVVSIIKRSMQAESCDNCGMVIWTRCYEALAMLRELGTTLSIEYCECTNQVESFALFYGLSEDKCYILPVMSQGGENEEDTG